MRLHTLNAAEGSNRRKLRVGRGEGNGRGKTCGRGHKGQRSRAGSSQRPGFESGHIPLYRRLPHRGFNNYNFETTYAVVNLEDLERVEETVITVDVLKSAGLVRSNAKLVKILGDGEFSSKVKIFAHKFSKTAKAKIEAAGGEANVLEA
ncbi:MAG: 50S ribosomal protein L15 [Opitutales bacterium]